MFNTRYLFLALPLFAFACGGSEDFDGIDDSSEETTEETSEDALTVLLDNCASGESPNARIDPRQSGPNLYERSASSINSGCRDTTIVDFNVNSGHIYEFYTTTTFPTATNINDCNDSYIHMRLLRRSGSGWSELESQMVGASWRIDFSLPNLGFCSPPRVDQRNWLPSSTEYRVRARAYRHDGTYSKMIVGVFN